MSGPFKMRGWSPFTQKKETLHVKPGSTADKKSKGWKGLTVSEGQGSKRLNKAIKIVDDIKLNKYQCRKK